MNILGIINRLGDVKIDNEQSQTRRESLFNFANFAKLAVPAAVLTSLPAFGSTSSTKRAAAITDVLNFALKLEYLESEFYTMGVAQSSLIPMTDKAIFEQIKKHEVDHVTLLKNTISALGGTAVSKPTFDFTAGGKFNPFVVYADFLALAQAFEDTGVRAYKGQAANLKDNNDVLTAALSIHSVEARHASMVRRLRNKNGLDGTAKGWITGSSRGTLPAETQAVYAGATSEDNTMQGGVNVATITTQNTIAIQEAFDEPLTESETLAIASLFIV
ncbi:MAG: ferritin-like domain-containing protein [Bacteroidia bacterium]|nr:ferritin-like domain-containing protein [Bacteroidia bacterium]